MKKFIMILVGVSISLFADFTRDDSVQIVTDDKTGLQWQDNEVKEMNWQDAIEYCEKLELGGYADWRLPNINELGSIADDTKSNPSIDSVFRSTKSDIYWSSTTYVYSSQNAWIIRFTKGSYNGAGKMDHYYVRCVRVVQ